MHLLLIEDDAPLAHALLDFLAGQGFIGQCAPSLAQARALLPLAHWDAVLLDWQLPDGEGLTLLPLLRRQLPDSPVLMLTARDQITDRIRGLDAGADDYLVKPFDPQELLARLRAVERRISGTHSAVLRMPGLEIDLGRHQVLRDGQPVELTAKEWALLRVLAQRPERIHTRESLQGALYGLDGDASSNTLEVFISNLRRKIGRARIQTLRGLGYRLQLGAAPD
ncbi:response regulator [Extensimonas vulgaris]|uniref:Two-component system OmpR family response regulator n=1 Tax=Extensimonas vulgaris TaxID=1031594 RepID=A0A369AIW0_9BURK|nr:response regulator [Extensimonas vulgaris]RCX09043.1 two-component system OmpR family response regulator [Extensimonas vulgaris]TWI37279.1 two-component system OmpR family response regulator [Extensimonas vulgaris]TXD14239.1 response regulator [Extensimonas vulgaris]